MQALHFHQVPKISLIFWDLIRSVSDIKLIRTDLKHCIWPLPQRYMHGT
jgi:hypothetical protein